MIDSFCNAINHYFGQQERCGPFYRIHEERRLNLAVPLESAHTLISVSINSMWYNGTIRFREIAFIRFFKSRVSDAFVLNANNSQCFGF